MSKLGNLKRSFQAGGIKGVKMLLKDYLNRHNGSRKPKSEWSTESVVNSDMVKYGVQYGYYFDIYNPHSFTEKMHTYKLLYDDPSMSKIVDKFEFKEYVKNVLGSEKYTTKAFGVWDSIDEIEATWDSLPGEFVLKSTISSDGCNIVFVNDKSKITFDDIKNELEKCFDPMRTQLDGYARAYYTLKPRVLCEEYLHELDGNENLKDYKFYCFNGIAEFVYTTSRVFDGSEDPSAADYPRTFFDMDWNKLPISLADHPTADNAERPKHFEEMVEICKKLSTGFPFVRVDFYDSENNPILGEMTFYPTGGGKPLKPLSFDESLGDKFILPPERLVKM